jgi:hypothetical protein
MTIIGPGPEIGILDELRGIAPGIYPAILSQNGAYPALGSGIIA